MTRRRVRLSVPRATIVLRPVVHVAADGSRHLLDNVHEVVRANPDLIRLTRGMRVQGLTQRYHRDNAWWFDLSSVESKRRVCSVRVDAVEVIAPAR